MIDDIKYFKEVLLLKYFKKVLLLKHIKKVLIVSENLPSDFHSS